MARSTLLLLMFLSAAAGIAAALIGTHKPPVALTNSTLLAPSRA